MHVHKEEGTRTSLPPEYGHRRCGRVTRLHNANFRYVLGIRGRAALDESEVIRMHVSGVYIAYSRCPHAYAKYEGTVFNLKLKKLCVRVSAITGWKS